MQVVLQSLRGENVSLQRGEDYGGPKASMKTGHQHKEDAKEARKKRGTEGKKRQIRRDKGTSQVPARRGGIRCGTR